jgi:hypothetical protein
MSSSAHDPQHDADEQQDDADGGKNADAKYHAQDQQNQSENYHGSPGCGFTGNRRRAILAAFI